MFEKPPFLLLVGELVCTIDNKPACMYMFVQLAIYMYAMCVLDG